MLMNRPTVARISAGLKPDAANKPTRACEPRTEITRPNDAAGCTIDILKYPRGTPVFFRLCKVLFQKPLTILTLPLVRRERYRGSRRDDRAASFRSHLSKLLYLKCKYLNSIEGISRVRNLVPDKDPPVLQAGLKIFWRSRLGFRRG